MKAEWIRIIFYDHGKSQVRFDSRTMGSLREAPLSLVSKDIGAIEVN